MSGKRRLVLVGILLASSCLLAIFSAQATAQKRGLTAPESLLQLLEKGDRDCLGSGGLRKAVTVQRIQLAPRSGEQIVVKGSGLCLCGAQNCSFWIYQKTGSNYELILTGAGARKVRAGAQAANGYRDVISESHASASETIIRTYRYDGSRYGLKSCVSRAYYNDTKKPDFTPCGGGQKSEPEKRLPADILNRQLTTLNGRQFKLSDLSDRTIVLNLFASSCPECLPNLRDLIDLNQNYVTHRIEIIGVVSDKNEKVIANLRKLVGEQMLNFPVVWDTGGFTEALVKATAARGPLPQTFVIDGTGVVRKYFPGFNQTQTPQLLRQALDQIDQNPTKSP